LGGRPCASILFEIRAREVGYIKMGDELLEIADDASNDWLERQNKDGATFKVVDQENISRSRLRVDTRKWLLSKMLPKVFGDRLSAEVSGKDGAPLMPEASPRDMARAVVDILRLAQVEGAAEPVEEANGHEVEDISGFSAPASPRLRRFNPETGKLE
jgi:hypothetical protein